MNAQRRPARACASASPRRSRGATLIIGMILLLLMTSVSLTSLKAVKTDEHLSGNMQDRYLAFQAAEAALREAEELLGNDSPKVFNGNDGLYRYNDPDVPSPLGLDSSNARLYGQTLTGVTEEPLYIVEQMEPSRGSRDSLTKPTYGVKRTYRVTAVGFGASPTTRAVLQSTYLR